MQALVSQDVCQLEIDYIVIDRLIARERGTMADASAHRDRLTTQARVTEALPVALSRAVCGAGLSQFVRTRSRRTCSARQSTCTTHSVAITWAGGNPHPVGSL